MLLSELTIGLLLLEQRSCAILSLPLDHLSSILRLLDQLIQLLPNQSALEKEMLCWPGIFAWTKASGGAGGGGGTSNPAGRTCGFPTPVSLPVIRRAEFENHNKDGGLWLIIDGKVYDIQDFKGMAPECGSDALLRWAGLDATEAFGSAAHSSATVNLLESFCVGVLETAPCDPDSNKDRADKAEFHTFSWACTSALERFSEMTKINHSSYLNDFN